MRGDAGGSTPTFGGPGHCPWAFVVVGWKVAEHPPASPRIYYLNACVDINVVARYGSVS